MIPSLGYTSENWIKQHQSSTSSWPRCNFCALWLLQWLLESNLIEQMMWSHRVCSLSCDSWWIETRLLDDPFSLYAIRYSVAWLAFIGYWKVMPWGKCVTRIRSIVWGKCVSVRIVGVRRRSLALLRSR